MLHAAIDVFWNLVIGSTRIETKKEPTLKSNERNRKYELTTEWNAFGNPLAGFVADSSGWTQQLEASFAVVRGHRAHGKRFVGKEYRRVGWGSGKSAYFGDTWNKLKNS